MKALFYCLCPAAVEPLC